jgi:hypothetical protein
MTPHDHLIWLASFLDDVHHPAGSFEARFLDHVNEVLDALFIVFEVLGGKGAAFHFKHFSCWR